MSPPLRILLVDDEERHPARPVRLRLGDVGADVVGELPEPGPPGFHDEGVHELTHRREYAAIAFAGTIRG